MKNYRKLINEKNIPEHVAIIMDGNGRWAKKNSLTRNEGHRKGASVIEPLMDTSLELGIKAVSLYAFSTENWVRPLSEVRGLWQLLEDFFKNKIDLIMERGIRVMHSGSMTKLPPSTKKTIKQAIDLSSKNKNITLNFCINYGGQQEIIEAVNRWNQTRKGKEKLTKAKLEKFLYTAGLPEVDILIRTSGEYRISNFLLWQIAYAELVFMDVLWPDFNKNHLCKAIYEYQQRVRRFGGL